MATVLLAILCTVLLALLGLVALALWTRRGDGRPDPPGLRTLALFKGGERYIREDERRREELEGSAALGGGLLDALIAELAARSIVARGLGQDDYGWGVNIELRQERAYLLLGASIDADADWVLTVLDPSGGGPGPCALLPHIDEALKALPGISGVAWHRRELYAAGDRSSGAKSPIAATAG